MLSCFMFLLFSPNSDPTINFAANTDFLKKKIFYCPILMSPCKQFPVTERAPVDHLLQGPMYDEVVTWVITAFLSAQTTFL